MGKEILLTTAMEEEIILGRIGAKFDTPEKRRKLWAYRLQKYIANKIHFSNLWQTPEALKAFIERNPFLEDESTKKYVEKLEEAV